MPILPFPLDEEERKRRMLAPPNIPTPTRALPPPSRGIPGEIPGGPMLGAPYSSPPPEAPGPRGVMLPSPGVPGGERTTMPGLVGSPPLTRPQQLAEERHLYGAGTPTRKKSMLLGALEGLGSGQGLTGAISGAVYGAADPRGMRRRRFEREEKPRLMEQWRLEDMDRARQMAEAKAQEGSAFTAARIGSMQSENEARAAGVNVARQNAQRQASVAESQIALNRAREEAARTGNPTYVDIDEGGGKVTKYQVFPNGTMRLVGASGAAAISRANIKSREGIAARREAGANARAAGRRSKKVATIDDIDAAVRESGLSELEVKRRFIEKRYQIIEE